MALIVDLSALTAWNFTLFELLSVRLASMTKTASPKAGTFEVAVMDCWLCFERDSSVINSEMHLRAKV
jgi:hypothetical protein